MEYEGDDQTRSALTPKTANRVDAHPLLFLALVAGPHRGNGSRHPGAAWIGNDKRCLYQNGSHRGVGSRRFSIPKRKPHKPFL